MSHQIVYKVDGESQSTDQHQRSANAILEAAGLSPADHYLIETKGKGGHQESYENRGTELIHLHPGSTFISVFIGQTPVSELPISGPALFSAQLRQLGYEALDKGDGRLTFPYEIEVGKHKGLQVTLGIQVPPDFPLSPPSGIHISRRFHANASGGVHPKGGIHKSPFGDDWEYWSRRFDTWQASRQTAAEYMAFVRQLWATQ